MLPLFKGEGQILPQYSHIDRGRPAVLDLMQLGLWVCSPVSCLTRVLGSWTLETVERMSVKIDSWEKKILGGRGRGK